MATDDVLLRAEEAADASGARRTIRRVYLASGAVLVGNQAFTILLFVILPAIQAGLINWGTAICAITFYILDGGVETAIVVVAKRHPVGLVTITSVVLGFRSVAAVLALAAWLIAMRFGWLHPTESLVLLLVGSSNLVRLFQTPFWAALQVSDRQADAAVIGLLPVVSRLVGLAVLILAHVVSISSVLVISLLSDIAGLGAMAVAATSELKQAPGQLDARKLTRELLFASPMITASQAVVMAQSRIDWLLVAALTSYSALASYAIANKATELVVLGGSIFGRAALPWFVEGWTSRDIPRTVRLIVVASSITGLILALAGWPILHLATRDKYAAAAPMIPILAALSPALVLFQVVQFAMLAKGAARSVVWAGGLGVAAQVLVDLIAIPRLGAIGATLGMVVFAFLSLPLMLWIAQRKQIIPSRPAAELLLGALGLPVVLAATYALYRFV